MSSLLVRGGFVIIVVAVVYLAAWEIFREGADDKMVRNLLVAGAACIAGGVVMKITSRAMGVVLSPTCPRCGRPVARGRVYCEEHLTDTINKYRDRERRKDG
jgi:hypothetical protein